MKSSYHLKEDGFEARWFEGTSHRDKAIIWMHGSGMNETICAGPDTRFWFSASISGKA